jgi:hypothetical protein
VIEDGCLSKVTGGRAPYFSDLFLGEAAAHRFNEAGRMRRGQVSLKDKSLKNTSPGALELEKGSHPL